MQCDEKKKQNKTPTSETFKSATRENYHKNPANEFPEMDAQ